MSMSDKCYEGSFFDYFITIHDPRQDEKVKHKLIDILFIVVTAVICRCDEWHEMELWATEREEWLRKYIELPNGIPSQYTLERVCDVIDPKQFAKCFVEWMKEVTELSKGTIIAIDGKTARCTAEKGKKTIHIVYAWCSSNKMILGQVKTDEKSNEITAVPELLDMLFIKGCIVTVDALNTQKKTVEKIVKEKKADYVVALKGNHETLYNEVQDYYLDAETDGFKNTDIQYYRTIEKGHGRIEERRYYYSTDIKWMDARKDWSKMKGIGMVIRKVQNGEKETEERQFHFGSVDLVKDYADAVRAHWNIESTHWSLDVTFREDANRTRKGKAPENLALLRRLALNVVKKDHEKHAKRSLKARRFLASLNTDYLDYLLSINF
jgi:predicted transposase YbfD/YdcC